jgi:uncharacterized membrane protein
MLTTLANLGTAFGLSSSAGLNAYIPLLMFSVSARLGFIELQEPYNALESWWAIGLITIMLIVETFVDKIPAVDTINDAIQTLVRPAAGAFLFAANANLITDASPLVAVAVGIVLAGGVHTAKTAARPVVTATTAGTGNWVVSIAEDVMSFVASLMALVLPVLIIITGVPLLLAFITWVYRRRQHKETLVFK